MLAIYNCVITPLDIAFTDVYGQNEEKAELTEEICIDFFFLFDMIIRFRSSYIHPDTGDEIMKPKQIA